MKAKPAAAYLILVIFLPAVWLLLAESANANPIHQMLPAYYAPKITINSDGSITPETGLISQNGNTYTLTTNVTNYQINLICNNIIFDGAGYTINDKEYQAIDENGSPKYIGNYQSDGILFGTDGVGNFFKNSNVTIKNINVLTGSRAIHLYFCSNCQITGITSQSSIVIYGNNNIITNCTAPISIFQQGSGNLILRNNISDLYIGAGGNTIYLNNIFVNLSHFGSANNFLDNGSLGNYWADYTTRYPNASQIDHTGIGDTPYIIEGINISDGKPLGVNIDNHPLIYPYNFENDSIALPALPTPTPLPAEEVSESSLMAYVPFIAVSTTIAIAVIGLIYYQRKKKASHF
jgi:hypothetical protein